MTPTLGCLTLIVLDRGSLWPSVKHFTASTGLPQHPTKVYLTPGLWSLGHYFLPMPLTCFNFLGKELDVTINIENSSLVLWQSDCQKIKTKFVVHFRGCDPNPIRQHQEEGWPSWSTSVKSLYHVLQDMASKIVNSKLAWTLFFLHLVWWTGCVMVSELCVSWFVICLGLE